MFILPSKPELRTYYREQRRLFPKADRVRAAQAATGWLLNNPLFRRSQHVACYQSYGDEIDTQYIMQITWRAGKQCYLPVVAADNTLDFVVYNQGDSLVSNRYGILEPTDKSQVIDPLDLDLIIAPLLAFDMAGRRLGTGGGYYDRTLAFKQDLPREKPFFVGFAFSVQQADQLPEEPQDVLLDSIVTEDAWFPITKKHA